MRGNRTLTLVVTGTADDDIGEHFRYIRKDSPDSALRFLSAVESTGRQLCEYPRSGRRIEGDRLGELRVRQVQGFPSHLIINVVEAEELVMARVVHAARDLSDLVIQW